MKKQISVLNEIEHTRIIKVTNYIKTKGEEIVNMKCGLSFLLALVLLIAAGNPVTVLAAKELPFTDVPNSQWYREFVEYVYENDLMDGVTDDKFEPLSTLTRAMFVTVLGRMDGVNEKQYSGSSFYDVPQGYWYSSYVEWAAQNGIVDGYAEHLFGPDRNVTREQMATMISRYLDTKGITLTSAENSVTEFKDASTVSVWARKGLETMRRTGIIEGNANGCFLPQNYASRAEAAAVFARMEQAIETRSSSEPIFVKSGQIQDYKGNTYTVLDIEDSVGMTKVPGCYLTMLAIYNNYIYYTEDVGTGGGPTTLTRMKLDGSNKKVILNDLDSISDFCIYDNRLYYTACTLFDTESYYASKSIDLDTLQTRYEDYYFNNGNDEVWIISTEYYGDEKYCSYPGYIQIKDLPDGSNWTEQGVFDVYDENMFFFVKYSIMNASVYDTYTETLAVGPYVDSYYGYFIAGDGLYFKEYDDDYFGECDDAYWHRYDLLTGEETICAAMGLDDDTIYISLLAEINGKLYYKHYLPDSILNTECLEYDLATDTVRSIGIWFES